MGENQVLNLAKPQSRLHDVTMNVQEVCRCVLRCTASCTGFGVTLSVQNIQQVQQCNC